MLKIVVGLGFASSSSVTIDVEHGCSRDGTVESWRGAVMTARVWVPDCIYVCTSVKLH